MRLRKKAVSILLLPMLLASLICMPAKAEEKKYAIPIDLSDAFNAKVYLSKENEGNISNISCPDYFTNKSGTNEPIALNKDTIQKSCTNGILEYNGTEYLIPLEEKKANAVYCYPWINIAVNPGNYTQYSVLAVSDGNDAYSETLYTDAVYQDGTRTKVRSFRVKNRSADDTENLVTDAGALYATRTGNASGDGKIYEYSINIEDSSKKIVQINFSHASAVKDTGTRILAMSCKDSDGNTYTVDLSGYFNAKVYLSKNNEGSERLIPCPDYFTNKSGTNEPIALNKDTIKKSCINGILEYNGTKYLMPLEEKKANAVYCYPWINIAVSPGNYTQYSVLAVSDGNDAYSETLYTDAVYQDGTRTKVRSFRVKNRSADDTENLVTDAGVLYATRTGSASGDGKIYEYSINIEDSSKKIAQINFSHASAVKDTGTRILAMSCKDSDGNTYTVDLSGYFNAKVYLSKNNEGSERLIPCPDYFTDSAGIKDAIAVDTVELSKLCKNGLFEHDGISYLLNLKENEKQAVYCKPWISIDVDKGYYCEYRFLAISDGEIPYNETLYTEAIYEDGTTSKLKSIYIKNRNDVSDTSNLAASADMVYATKKETVSGKGNIYEYSVKISDTSKKITKINFAHASGVTDTGTRILALSCIYPDNADLDARLLKSLSSLPQPEKCGLAAVIKLNEMKEIADMLQSREGTENLPGLQKYMSYMNRLDTLCGGAEVVLYVSENGNDEGFGTEPVKSIKRAKKIVRELKSIYGDKSYRVVFREGTYRFDKATEFDINDSGTENNPIIYEAYSGEKVQFKGSVAIDATSAKVVSDETVRKRLPEKTVNNVVEIDLKKSGVDKISKFVSNGPNDVNNECAWIYANGKEEPIAQYPNGDGVYSQWTKIINPGDANLLSTNGGTIAVDENVGNWKDADSIYLGGYFGWDFRYERINVKSIDAENKEITLATGTDLGLKNNASRRWKAFNVLEELDSPGEWFIDRDTMMLYYYPTVDFKESSLELSVMTDPFIEMNGTENVVFRNIEFSQSRGNGISLGAETKNIQIQGCSFENISRSAIKTSGSKRGELEPGYNYLDSPSFIKITDCDFYNIGSSAIHIQGGGNRQTLAESGIEIINNYINKASQLAKNKAAVFLQGGVGIRLEHNLIRNVPFHAINFFGNNHIIRYNEVENACYESTDAGTIYSGRSYVMRGSEVAYNFIHDYRVIDDKIPLEQTSAIYLDDMMSGVNVHHNIIVNGQTGIHISGGQHNKIENNIIFETDRVFYTGNPGDDPTKLGSMPDDAKLALTYPKWSESYPELQETVKNPGPPIGNVIRYNLSDKSASVIKRMTDLGTVSDNYVSDADIFADSAKKDYRIKNGAEILSKLPQLLSENNFDIESIGLQKSEYRKEIDSYNKDEFVKIYPKDDAEEINPYSCTFSWETSKYADGYLLVIAEDSELKNIVFRKETHANLCNVKSIDGMSGKYYWQVYAINRTRQNASEWEAAGGVYSFNAEKNWIYESDSKPSKSVDINDLCNSKAFLLEGEADESMTNSYGYKDGNAINGTKLQKTLDNFGGVLNVGGRVYKLSKEYRAINTNISVKTEISPENEKCESVGFLVAGYEAVYDYPIRIYYKDGTFEEQKIDVGGYNSVAGRNDKIFSPAFKLGTVNCNTGECVNTGGYIYEFNIAVNDNKELEKIVFDAKGIEIFAISLILPEKTILSDGSMLYNIMLNGNIVGDMSAVCAMKDKDGILTELDKSVIRLEGENEWLWRQKIPKEAQKQVMELYFWNDFEKMTPYSYKIKKEVEK